MRCSIQIAHILQHEQTWLCYCLSRLTMCMSMAWLLMQIAHDLASLCRVLKSMQHMASGRGMQAKRATLAQHARASNGTIIWPAG